MDNKEKVLTLASAARKVGMDPEELRELIYEGKLDAVETEGGNLLIGEESLRKNISHFLRELKNKSVKL